MARVSLRRIYLVFSFIVFLLFFHNFLFKFDTITKPIEKVFSFQNKFQKNASHHSITKWRKCINSIHQRTLNLLSDKLTDEVLLKNPVILVDPAYHRNVGDNLLSYGELVFLEQYTKNHIECGVIQSVGLNEKCREFTKFPNNTLALWQAGGNWGDLYGMHKVRIKTFIFMLQKNMTIISMPQSLHYVNKDKEKKQSEDIRKIIQDTIGIEKAKQQIIFTWRQEDSYQQALKLYPYVDNRLVPDIAFMIGPIKNSNAWLKTSIQTVDLLFLLRHDEESIVKGQRQDKILQEFINEMSSPSKNITFRIVDWNDREKMFQHTSSVQTPMRQVWNRGAFDYNSRFASAAALFSSGRIVVTDMLHGSIFAFLSFKPHVFIDQMYRKIEETRNVAFNSSHYCQDGESLMYAQSVNLKDAVRKAIIMLEKYKHVSAY